MTEVVVAALYQLLLHLLAAPHHLLLNRRQHRLRRPLRRHHLRLGVRRADRRADDPRHPRRGRTGDQGRLVEQDRRLLDRLQDEGLVSGVSIG